MRLRAQRPCTRARRRLGLRVEFAAGEELRTEISAKFTRARLEADFEAAGLELERWYTDDDELFALSLAAAPRAGRVPRMEIEGSGALIAGGASGLGEATARGCTRRGAGCVIADLNAERGQALAAELGARADVRDAPTSPTRTRCRPPSTQPPRPRWAADRGLLRGHRLGRADRRQARRARARSRSRP